MSLLVDRRDLDFQLYEVLGIDDLCSLPRFEQHDRSTFDAVLESAYQLAEGEFAGHAAQLDANEPTFDGERVHIIPEVKAALDAYIEGGFLGAAFDEEVGGLQLPYSICQALAAVFTAANVGTAGYPFLSAAAANLLRVVGSPEQQARYMQPMIAGRFFGTMCLSEPQAGSSLGDIRTRAIAQTDGQGEGKYRIVGNKVWISGGEHDLAENIIHMVLARIEGAPAGTKGISLFIVPKFLVNEDGSLGERNGVRLAGLNHKMGYRGTVNTVLNFGEQDDCIGYLVGEPNQGLAGMFHMMNEARIGVGLGATVLGYTGYLHSLDYARTRLQGRKVSSPDPQGKPVAIIEHTDVKRMLLAQKASVEGALGLCLYCARLVDIQEASEDQAQREQAGLLLEILTPIAKAWPSDWCLEANKHAIQILGGYGYTRDYPVERFYRDNRLNPIHEGTNGIQALDLLGRKVVRGGGTSLKALLAEFSKTAEAAADYDELQEFSETLKQTVVTVGQTTQSLVAEAAGDADRFVANATSYLQMLGHAVIAWQWLRQALVAVQADAGHDTDRHFYAGKLAACRYFFRRELPAMELHARLVAQGEDSCLTMQAEYF